MVRCNLILASVLCLATLADPAGADVRIGIGTPLTGPVAWAGGSNLTGAELAVADLNVQGGVRGERIELIVADDFCDPHQAVVAAKKLIDAGVVLAIAHHCSHSTLPASEVYAAADVLMITPFTTNPRLTEQGFPGVFRLCGRDDRQSRIAGALLAERFGGQPIAILHDSTVYGQGLAELVQARLNERGIAEVLFEGIERGQVDYLDVVDKLQAMEVEILYFAGLRYEPGLIMRQAYDRGYRPQLVASDGVGGEEFAMIAGPAAEGTLMPISHPRRPPPRMPISPSGSPPGAMRAASGSGPSAPTPSSRPGRRRSSAPAPSPPPRSRTPSAPTSSTPWSVASASTRRAM
jgi:branched-chain amino acid transport system substrate-binding protein